MSGAIDVLNDSCRVCGCTHITPCVDKKASTRRIAKGRRAALIGCHWVEKDLCNVCADAAHAVKLTRDMLSSVKDLSRRRAFARSSAQMGGDKGLPHSGALRSRKLVESEYAHAAKRMVYWLTPLGREVARRG